MSSLDAPLASSASKLRRNRAAATRRKLFEAGKKQDPILGMQLQLETLTSTVNSLYLLLAGPVAQPFHFTGFGGPDQCGYSWAMPEGDDKLWSIDHVCPTATDQKHFLESSGHAPTSDALQRTSDYRLWLPNAQVNVFCAGSVLEKELKVEAAMRIQHAFREHAQFEQESQSMPSHGSDNPACCKCGKRFGAQTDPEYEGDACDICGRYFHSTCLHELLDARGERSLCDECEQGTTDIERAASPSAEVPAMARRSAPIAAPVASTEDIASEVCNIGEEDVLKPLNSTLDFILRFLEGEHAKSSKIHQSVRASILEEVKSAIAWKQQTHPKEKVQEKVAELNAMMGDIVRQL